MKRILALLLALVALLGLAGCDEAALIADELASAYDQYAIESEYIDDGETIDRSGWYYSAEDVGLYLYTYGRLPDNFITKDEARALGWEGGSVESVAEGCAIGGDVFGNREGLLPAAQGRVYYECDIDTDGRESRGPKRIVFSNDGLIYYTEDHYESFTLMYGEDAG